jgi:hypothetical protein
MLGCAAALALAVAALASASYVPSMGVFQVTYKPKAAGPVTIVVAQELADDPTAKITIYVAPGYSVALGQAPGTRVGSVLAHFHVLDRGASSSPVSGRGAVTVDDPGKYVANTCSPGRHEAVWVLNASVPGQPPNPIPVYIDHAAAPETAFSAARMQMCFRAPDLPAGNPNRAPNGIKFLDAAITTTAIFRNPPAAGTARWRAVFTPYNPRLGTPNPAGTREAQGVVPMPYTISVARKKARRGFFRLAGSVDVGGKAPSGVRLTLFAGVRAKGGVSFRIAATTKTRRGKYVFDRRLPAKLTYYFVERRPTAAKCAAGAAGVPCT